MSQQKTRPQKRSSPPARNQHSRRTVVAVSGALLCLLLTGVILARWRNHVVPSAPLVLAPMPQASASPPNPFVPKRASREYVYVNDKLQAIEEPKPPAGGTAFDFNGNTSGDIVVYRPAEGNWYVLDISTDPVTSLLQQLGAGDEKLVPGDYDGDGKTDIAIWRPNGGNCAANGCGWHIKLSGSNGAVDYRADWGQEGDLAVPADYDKDGKMDRAVWRPSLGNWYILNSSGTPVQSLINWGQLNDKPVPADYDGDGKADAAVFRPTEGNWYIQNSGGGNTTVGWGASGDWLVPADYDGDGKADIAVWRPSEGNWYIRQSSNLSMKLVNWGAGNDLPVPADYDGDGRIDIAVWRPSEGNWYIRKSSDGITLVRGWGNATDIPVPLVFVKH